MTNNFPKQAWGNAAGWAIAATLAVAMVIALFVVARTGAVTPQTAFGADTRNYGAITLPLQLDAILQSTPARDEDAGRLYLDAADAYADRPLSRRPYDDVIAGRTRGPVAAGELPLLDKLIDAASAKRATIFADSPEVLVNYDRDLVHLEGLYALGQAAIAQAGLLAARNGSRHAAQARTLYEAAYVLGARLCEERIVHRELELGYRLVSTSLGGMIALARKEGDDAHAARLAAARQAFADSVNNIIQPVWEKLSAINDVSREGDLADVHAGDVFAIAQSDAADPMWRTEAILRLGKLRHDAPRPADRRGAQRLLEDLVGSSDPRLRLAAERALSLTAVERMHAR